MNFQNIFSFTSFAIMYCAYRLKLSISEMRLGDFLPLSFAPAHLGFDHSLVFLVAHVTLKGEVLLALNPIEDAWSLGSTVLEPDSTLFWLCCRITSLTLSS